MKDFHRRCVRALQWLITVPEGQAIVPAAPPVPVRDIFRRFWPYARPYRWWLVLSLPFILVGTVLDTASIWMFKLLVDEVLVPADFGPFPRIALAYVGLTLLGGLVSFGNDYLSAWVGGRFLLELRTSFFRHLHSLSLDFFERRQLGDVLSRLTGDIGSIESLVLDGPIKLLSRALRIAFFTGMLIYLRWELTLVALLITPLFWVAARRFSDLIRRVSRERRRRSGSISAVAEESLANAPLVQAYGRQETEVERFHRESLGSFAAHMASTRLRGLFSPLIEVIELGGLLIVVAVGTWQISQGGLSLGGLLVFLAYLHRLYGPVRGISRLTNSVYSASASAERMIEFLDQRPAVQERPDAVQLTRARGLVQFDDVSFVYPGGAREAVAECSLRVEPGGVLALVGPSGAGKTTIAKLLLRFYDPSDGRILLDGHDLRELRLESLRHNLAIVLQETLVFDGTIRDNIAYGRPGASEQEIVRAAERADAHEFIVGMAAGYDTPVGQKGRRLSGGQRQRIAIARAMIRDAPILILDEPTTGLDAESGQRILEPLRRLMSGRTTIIISHNLMTVREATSIVVLEAGRIVDRGIHADLLTRDGRYAELYRLHQGSALSAAARQPVGP